MVRSIGTMGAVAALVGGVTFAQLQSNTVALTGNNINTSAALQVSNGGTYSTTAAGFTFTGVVPPANGTGPGLGTPSANQTFYLKNTGPTAYSLNLTVPTMPTFTVSPTDSITTSGVFVNISCSTGASGPITLYSGNDLNTLTTITGANLTGTLQPGDVATCLVNISMDRTALPANTNSVTTTTGFNMDFIGTTI
jgi:hypothetical protein